MEQQQQHRNDDTHMGETNSVTETELTEDNMSDVPIQSAEAGSSLPTPDEVRATVSPQRKNERPNAVIVACVMAVLAVLALIIGLSVGLRGTDNRAAAAQASTEPAPRQSTVDDVLDYLLAQGVSEGALLRDGSPQNLAARWLAEDDELNVGVPKQSVAEEAGYRFLTRYVMAVNFFALRGPGWKYKYEFMSHRDVCQWAGLLFDGINFYRAGVLCDPDYGVIKSLYLDLNRLNGVLPAENGMLTTLETLDFNFNQLEGAIPTELCQLTDLAVLGLAYNGMDGDIPECMSGLTKLQSLYMSNNLFTGDFADSIGKLNQLERIYLDDNLVSGDLTSALNDFANIKIAYLEDNDFIGTLGAGFMENCDELLHLDISNNDLQGVIPTHLLQMPKLRLLDLHLNELQGDLPLELEVNEELLFLALHANALTGPIPPTLANLKNLFHLDLSNNLFNSTMPEDLGSLSELLYLYLGNNWFEKGEIPAAYGSLTKLEELNLKMTNRNGTIPEFLGNMKELVLLDLDNNELSGEIPANLGQLTKLQFLLLNRNDLEGEPPSTLSNLTSMRAMFLEDNDLFGSLEELCLTPTFLKFKQMRNDTGGNEIIAADCGGAVPRLLCTCCEICCNPGRTSGDCHDNDVIAGLEPRWENLFRRANYTFGSDARYIDHAFAGNLSP